MNQAVLDLLNLETKKYKVEKIENQIVDNKRIKTITIKCISKKHRCPNCNKYTSSVHDTLKPSKLKFLDIAGYESKIFIIKRRFICHKCNIKFTETTVFNNKKCNISNRVKQKIRKDLLQYNLSLKYIAESNHVTDNVVRNELISSMKNYPRHVTKLPEVVSIDEFAADTNYGKYAFIINDPIKKKILDILPCRRKEYLINYFTNVTNRQSVKYVISDMYDAYLAVTKIMFPKAKFIVDRFHYVKAVMKALDDIRKRLQNEYGSKTKKYKLLKNKKNVSLLRNYYNDINWYTYTKRYKNGHMVEILRADLLDQILAISED